MKRNLKAILLAIEMPKAMLLFCVASWLFNMSPKVQQIQLGIPSGLMGADIDSAIAGWLAMVLLPVAYAGYILSRFSRMEPFLILRLQTKRKAFLYRFCCCTACMLLYVILLVAPLLASCGLDAVICAAMLLFLEEVFWMLAYLSFCLFMNTISAGACVLMLVTGCYMACKHIPAAEQFVPTTWGMYCRTKSMFTEGALFGVFVLRLILSCTALFGIDTWICTMKKGKG
ncbi:MAG: hypothetical protein Q4B32_09495 [Clostridia bacterium]|nr:hypothetical protein [Clostridia bacterium]